jgi:hypothetical protein
VAEQPEQQVYGVSVFTLWPPENGKTPATIDPQNLSGEIAVVGKAGAMDIPARREVGRTRMYIRLAPLLPFASCRRGWTGAVVAVLLLICPKASWAQCSEKVASFDLVQNEDGDLIIPALLQDTSTDMGLDFSFTWSSLRASTAQKLGLPLRKILTKRTYHTSGVEITHFLEVPSVKLGSMSKRMELMALPEEARIDPRINGWLALNVLADFDVEIDFGNAKLNLFQPGRWPHRM